MGTNAAIFYFNENTNMYDGVYVNWDGYLEGGVGETLIKFYGKEEAKKLCTDYRSDICQLTEKFEDIDWYDKHICRNTYKNLNFDDIELKIIGNVNYTYIFKDGEWIFWNQKFREWKPVSMYIKA